MAAEAQSRADASDAVRVDVRGAVDPAARDLAAAMIGTVLARHTIDGSAARVRLSGPPCPGRPGLMQVNLRVCGAPARVQMPGGTVPEAIAAGAHRLDRQIRRLTSGWEPWPWPDPQRHPLGQPGRRRDRAGEAGAVAHRGGLPGGGRDERDGLRPAPVRRRRDRGGRDRVPVRSGPTGVRLSRQRSMHPPARRVAPAVTVNPRRVPALAPDQAADQLCAGWLPFLFFTDVGSGRGSVLYRRYDGNLGVIVADPEARLNAAPVPRGP
jgi:hypothetical protein